MNPTVIGLGVILMLGGIAGHFNSHPKDWPILVNAVKGGLSHIKQCVVSWPLRDSIIALVLTVLISAWFIEVLL